MLQTKLKIALIEPVGNHGGAHYYDYALADGLAQNDVQVFFFTSTDTTEMKFDGVQTFYTFGNLWTPKSRYRRVWQYLKGTMKSYKIAKRNSVRIVHFQIYQLNWMFFLTYILARLYKLRIVMTLHDISSFISDKIPSFFERKIIYGIDQIIVHNTFSYNEIKLKYPDRYYHIIKHGNYLLFVKRVPGQKSTDDFFHLLFFGQIKKVKGLDILLEAIAKIKDAGFGSLFKLKVVGKLWKDDAMKYYSIVRKNKITDMVEFHFEYLPDDQVWELFTNTNLIILPYTRIYQSGVLIMGMSYGRALLTSDLVPFKEIIEEGVNGFTFKANDPAALASRILDIYQSRSNLAEIEQNAYQLMQEDFNWFEIASQTAIIYEKTLE